MSNNQKPYETFYIVRPEFSDADVQKIANKYKAVVEDHGGTVDAAAKWDRRKLAYPINGCKEGTYILMHFTGGPAIPAELTRLMRISDDVLRTLILVVEKPKVDKSEKANKPEKAEKTEKAEKVEKAAKAEKPAKAETPEKAEATEAAEPEAVVAE